MNTIKLTKEEREQVNNFIENMIAHRKPWLQKESEAYAKLHNDSALYYYYADLDDIEEADIRPALIDCFRNAVYKFKNKLIKESKNFNIHEKDFTNKINVIALEEIMNNLLGIE